jgi:hypothetical protein
MPASATPPTVRPSRAADAAESTAGRFIAAVRHGLDVLVAFATLRDAEAADGAQERLGHHPAPRRRPLEPHDSAPPRTATHPHRRPLRPASRTRRPGAVPPPTHACCTPLVTSRPARRRDRAIGHRQ